MGAATGLAVGGLQAFVIARRGSGALWWAAVKPPAWALAWIVTTFVITKNVKEQFPVFAFSSAWVSGPSSSPTSNRFSTFQLITRNWLTSRILPLQRP